MGRIQSAILGTVLAAAISCFAQDGTLKVHPAYEMTDIQPEGRNLLVGGMDLFSDGRLASCNWGNPGDVWVVKDAEKGTKATVRAERYAMGLQQVQGCKVVDDVLYVLQMGELTRLVDSDKDGKADRYEKVNDAFSTSESLLGYAFDLAYYGGSFYATLSADVMRGGMTAKPTLKDRSVFIRMGQDNSLEYLASGFRNPNGMGVGFGNRLFATDNQGSWTPSSKIIHLQKGKFYGHRTEPANRFQSQPETWPMAWLPHGLVSQTPGNVAFVREGPYKGQLLLAEQDDRQKGKIYRVSVQEVDGVMQGAVLPFCGGIGVGVSRVVVGKGGVIYAGLLGATGSWSNLGSMHPGLRRLSPRALETPVFEILHVRSTGNATIELEFTRAVGAGANSPSSYGVDTWTFQPAEGYGGGNRVDAHALTVQAATVKPDGKTVELRISGLAEKYLVNIKLNGVKSATGDLPWTPQTWFTLNRFGPGKIPDIAGCKDNRYVEYDADATVSDPAGCATLRSSTALRPAVKASTAPSGTFRLELPEGQPYVLRAFDVRGAERGRWTGRGPAGVPLHKAGGGLLILRLEAGSHGGTWVLPPGLNRAGEFSSR